MASLSTTWSASSHARPHLGGPLNPQRIQRREFKYLINEDQAARIRDALRPYCTLDPMAEGRPDNRYTIDSLYLDTWDLQLYAANNLELPRRFKARIRSYPAAPGSPAFFEVKGRDVDIILKTRGPVPRDQVAQLLDRPPATVENKAVERFLSLKIRHNLQPVCLVRYDREPWISTLDRYARVTFDTHIRHQRMDQWCPEPDERAWRYADSAPATRTKGFESPIILELKFERAVPTWLSRIVAKCDLDRRAFSKYGTAIKALYSPPELRTVRERG